MKKKSKTRKRSSSATAKKRSSTRDELLKSQLIELRDHLILLGGHEKLSKAKVIWFDIDFLSTVAVSRSKKWILLKKTLRSNSTDFEIGAICFSGTKPDKELDFDIQFWIGPFENSDEEATLFDKAKHFSNNQCNLVTDDFSISLQAQKRGIVVIHPDHANVFLNKRDL